MTVESRRDRGKAAPQAPPAGEPAPEAAILRPPAPRADGADSLVGRTLGGCQIIRVIGRGAMGTVYEARQLSLDRVVAFKTIRQDLCADRTFLTRFRQEARTVGRFNAQHVVQIHEVGVEGGVHFIIMEFVGGGSLRDYVDKRDDRRLPAEDALRFLREAAEGLLESERLRIVHRDIKPGNLLLDSRERLKIADFGIAKVFEADVQSTLTSGAGFVGTPLYMSPEQAATGKLDHRSDMYSLGATFYHLLTGAPPVEGQSIYEVIKRKSVIPSLSPRRIVVDERIPESLSRLIERMTALRPEDRYPSFQDLLRDIDRARSGQEVAPFTPPSEAEAAEERARPGPVPSRRIRWWMAAAAVVALGGVAYLGRGLLAPGGKSTDATKPPLGGVVVEGPKRAGEGGAQGGMPAEKGPRVVSDAGVGSGEEAKPEGGEETRGTRPPPAFPRAEFESRTTDLRQRLAREGPTEALLVLAQGVFRDLDSWASSPDSAEIRGQSELLVNAISDGNQRRTALENLRLEDASIAPPFTKVVGHRKEIEARARLPESDGPEMAAWMAAEKARLIADLEARTEPSVKALLAALEATRAGFKEWKVSRQDFDTTIGTVVESRSALCEAFPEGRAKWQEMIPDSLVSGLREEVTERARTEEMTAALVAGLDALAAKLSGASGWTPRTATEVEAAVGTAKTELEAIRKRDPNAPLGAAEGKLRESQAALRRWEDHAALRRKALVAIAAHDLAEAAQALASLREDRLEDAGVDGLERASKAIGDGFRALVESLDIEGAKRSFSLAEEGLRLVDPSSKAGEYVRDCAARADQIAALVETMAPVRGGEALVPERGSTRQETVGSFFIDLTEVSVAEYREFEAKCANPPTFEEVRRLWPDERTFESYGRGKALDPPYFSEVPDVKPAWPVEDVNYYQAQAYARWKGKDLPTVAEWFLAARGRVVGGKHELDVPSLDIRRGQDRPAPVGQGGLARAFPARYPVHHLAGNVAEWCRPAEEGARQSQLVGGRYLDSDPRYFTGERRDTLPLEKSSRGYGLRCVARPRDLVRDLLPVGLERVP